MRVELPNITRMATVGDALECCVVFPIVVMYLLLRTPIRSFLFGP